MDLLRTNLSRLASLLLMVELKAVWTEESNRCQISLDFSQNFDSFSHNILRPILRNMVLGSYSKISARLKCNGKQSFYMYQSWCGSLFQRVMLFSLVVAPSWNNPQGHWNGVIQSSQTGNKIGCRLINILRHTWEQVTQECA